VRARVRQRLHVVLHRVAPRVRLDHALAPRTFILLVTYFLLHLLAALPKCILAVIVIVVVFSILEEAPEDVRFFWKMRAWVDGGLMLLTFILSLFVGVEVRRARASPSSLGLLRTGAER